jgi:uncharacterized protein YjdB
MTTHSVRRGRWTVSLGIIRNSILVAIAAACSPEGLIPVGPAAIELSASALSFESLGEDKQLSATVTDKKGNPYKATITWTSADTRVATVSSNGIVTAVGPGTTSVTATTGAINKSIAIAVLQVPRSVEVTPGQVSLPALGATAVLTGVVKDARGNPITDARVSWSSSDATVASVDATGTVTAIGNGSATITASVQTLRGSATVQVAQQPTQLTLSPTSLELSAQGPTGSLTASARDARGNTIPPGPLSWSSSNTAVATVAWSGAVATVTGVSAGTAVITVALGGLSAAATVTVRQSQTVVIEPIEPYLATAASNSLWEIPVMIIRFLPTADGITLDQRVTSFPYPAATQDIPIRPAILADVRKRIEVFDRRVKFMLEEATRFRGYANPSAPPSIGYRVVRYVTVYEPMPVTTRAAGPCVPASCVGQRYFPDYNAVLTRLNAGHWVNTQGVKEIWIWAYEGNLESPESNMSSPLTGDISNSFRWNDDLPIYEKTYTVYGYNYCRSQNEAVHNHGHQLEAILGHADFLQNGNTNLFKNQFVGFDGTKHITGRAGWTHMPPNTTNDYDYLNRTPVLSDIEDWRPDNSGTKTLISSDRWRNLVYNWPSGTVPRRDYWDEDFTAGSDQRTEAQWYVYWMQNMPGRGNTIPLFAGQTTNWWAFTADWDAAITVGLRLATVPNGAAITVRNDYVGSILLDPGGTVQPGQSITINATGPTTVRVYDCGQTTQCIMDPYTLSPGKRYRVISDPKGPSTNLTIVEQ